MGGVCGTYGGRGEGLCWGNLRDRDHLEDLGIDGIILKWIFKMMWEGLD